MNINGSNACDGGEGVVSDCESEATVFAQEQGDLRNAVPWQPEPRKLPQGDRIRRFFILGLENNPHHSEISDILHKNHAFLLNTVWWRLGQSIRLKYQNTYPSRNWGEREKATLQFVEALADKITATEIVQLLSIRTHPELPDLDTREKQVVLYCKNRTTIPPKPDDLATEAGRADLMTQSLKFLNLSSK